MNWKKIRNVKRIYIQALSQWKELVRWKDLTKFATKLRHLANCRAASIVIYFFSSADRSEMLVVMFRTLSEMLSATSFASRIFPKSEPVHGFSIDVD